MKKSEAGSFFHVRVGNALNETKIFYAQEGLEPRVLIE
jgi:hypothetical protein